MSFTTSHPESGGFIQPSLSSPAPSASTATPSILPRPRLHPLKAGSTKETTVINHVDKTILIINRRHAKKFSSAFDDQAQQESERGYESFKEVAKDIEGLVDVLWVTGTRMCIYPASLAMWSERSLARNLTDFTQHLFKYHI